MDVIECFAMTLSAAPTVKDKELLPFGLVESASVNSFTDFIPSKFNESKVNTGKETETETEKEDFSNAFICHLIFYAFFCVSLVFYILIDLGLGSFIKNKFVKLMGEGKKTFFKKSAAFA